MAVWQKTLKIAKVSESCDHNKYVIQEIKKKNKATTEYRATQTQVHLVERLFRNYKLLFNMSLHPKYISESVNIFANFQ